MAKTDNGSENAEAMETQKPEFIDAAKGEDNQVTIVEEAFLALEKGLSEAQEQIDQLTGQVTLLTIERDDLQAKFDQSDAEIAVLTAERDGFKAQIEARVKTPRSRSGDVSCKARKIGPVDGQANVNDLLEAIGAAERVEIAFSDGKRELALPPVVVAGDCWAVGLVGLQLRLPELLVRGLSDRAITLGGYGLFLDDKQVAFAPREPFNITPGQQVNLKDDVVFA